MPDHVDAKAVDTAIEPETQHIVHRFAYSRVAPIEIRLLAQERMIVVLACRPVEAPGRSSEIADPIVRRRAIGLAIAPDIPIAPWIIPRGAALDRPGMPVGCRVGD